jgi:hypothetical protein
MTLIARGRDLEPRGSVRLPRCYIAPRSGVYALRHRDKVPGSKRNPRVKICISRSDRASNRNVTSFVRVGIESL